MSTKAPKKHTVNYDRGILVCPLCHHDLKPASRGLRCTSCKKSYGVTNGFINLIPDPAMKTFLVEQEYETTAGINEQRRITQWEQWKKILAKYHANTGSVLEIGAGGGYLTWGLLHRSDFTEVHVSDISPVFLNTILTERAPGSVKPTYYYLCDANQLPFREASVDCFIGNSVLHHFIDYRKTLEAAHRVLKTGGKAFFFEPVVQGKAYVALLTRLLWKVDSRSATPLFTEDEHKKLRHMSFHIVKQERGRNENSDIEKLKKVEDKYIFDIPALERMAHDIGFSALHIENNIRMDYSYVHYVCFQLELSGFERKKVLEYEYLFNTVRDTLGAMMPEAMTSPTSFLVFEK